LTLRSRFIVFSSRYVLPTYLLSSSQESQYRTTPILQLIRVIGTHATLQPSSKRKPKQDVIYIGDSDSEGEDEVLVTPTKRQRIPLGRDDSTRTLNSPGINAQPRWGVHQDVKPDVDLGRNVKPYIGLGRYVKPKHGLGRDVKPNTGRPAPTAMGQVSVRFSCTDSR